MSLLSVLVLVLGTASCCKEGSGNTDPAASADPTPAASAKDPDSILTAGVKFGATMCAKRDGDKCIAPTDSFPGDTPEIHIIYVTKEIPDRNQDVKFRWIAEDVGAAAAKGTLIREVVENTGDDLMLGVATHYTMHTVMTKPTKGWPPGKYKVDIVVAGSVKETARFTVTPASP